MNSLFQRAINIIKTPKTEWPVIAAEPATVSSLYIPYVLVLAAIGPIALLLGGGGTGLFRFSSAFLLRTAIWQYVASLVSVALFALVINLLATNFGATKNQVQAFKTAVYASTAAWIAAVGGLLGFSLSALLMLAGGIYSIYLLYLALPHTMKAPPEKATTYTVVIIIAVVVISIVLGAVGGALGMAGGMAGWGAVRGAQNDVQVFDRDSALGRLESAGRELEKAEKEGKLDDPSKAMGQVMGALSGAGAGTSVEALSADTLRSFIPEQLGGLSRQGISAERNAAMGMQIASARARYGAENELRLEITDTGGAAGFMALAGWAGIESSSEEGTRTERVGTEGDRLVKEVWDSASKSGEYTVVIGKRFIVKVEGEAGSLSDLKSAASAVDLDKLESLKNEGVTRE
jgi:Yip1 domain